MEKIEIRRMNKQDVSKAAAIEKENFSLPWTEESFLQALEKKENIYLTALEGEQVIGYIGMWTVLDEGEITQVSVKKDFQGRHIGRRLLEMLEEEGKGRGWPPSFLKCAGVMPLPSIFMKTADFRYRESGKIFMKIPERTAFSWRRKLPAIANSVFDSHWDL